MPVTPRNSLLYLFFSVIFVFSVGRADIVLSDQPPLQSDIYAARDKVLPALIHIQPVNIDYRTGKMRKQSAVGSGIIFHEDGYAVTNYHVAGKAEKIIITLNDNEQVRAELVGGDPLTDIAVIKLDLSDYEGQVVIAEFGDSDSIQVRWTPLILPPGP